MTQRARNPLKWSATIPLTNKPSQTVAIVPDQTFSLEFTAERKRAYFFLEADTAKMPVNRSNLTKSSVQKKLLACCHCHQAKLHAQQVNIQDFRVLTITTTRKREQNMIRAVHGITGRHGSNLFLVHRCRVLDWHPQRARP